MKDHIAILGAGAMACALAVNLARHKKEILLYCIERDVEEELNCHACNTKYLPDVRFAKHIRATSDIETVLKNAAVAFVAVPSFAIREVLHKARPFFSKNAIIASITKGLDPKTLEPLILTEQRLLPRPLQKNICTIGGPAIAKEMAQGSPTALVLAGDKKVTHRIKKLLASRSVKIATTSDIKGVGLASALKNPYAIALGLCDGLKLPTNTKAMIFTIALQEMEMILKKAGADHKTATGLAGLGDLIVTGFSPHGRNRTYGERLVNAKTKDPKKLGLTTVEGITATAEAMSLAKKLHLSLPLLSVIDSCLRARHNYIKPFTHYLTHLRLS